MLPAISDVGTLVIAVFARIVKSPAVPRTTAAGPAALVAGIGATTPVNKDATMDSATSAASTFLTCSSPV